MYRYFSFFFSSLFLSLLVSVANAAEGNKVSPETKRLIWSVAQQEDIDPYLLYAVVSVESSFNPRSISDKGAVGLMQLMPGTARELGVTNRFSPKQNLQGGARYLKKMIQRFSSVRLALAAYNAGPSTVARFKGIPPFPETRRYVGNVIQTYARINPGSNSTPRKIYRYKKPNGTLVLTDRRQVFSLATVWSSGQRHHPVERVPLISISRYHDDDAHPVPVTPDVPAKRRTLQIAKASATGQSRPSGEDAAMEIASAPRKTKTPLIQLASWVPTRTDRDRRRRLGVSVEEEQIPVVRLTR